MMIAILSGLLAGALWGIGFVAPQLIGDAPAGALVVMRFGVFGLMSVAYLAWIGFNPFRQLSRRDWFRLILLGFFGNSFYYLLLTFSVMAGSTAQSALIIGTLPVMFALVGNIQRPIVSWPRLLVAISPVAAGIVLLTLGDVPAEGGAPQYLGVALALAAMISWLIYGLWNAQFLADGFEGSPMLWSALVGLGTLITLPLPALAAIVQDSSVLALDPGRHWPLLFWGVVAGVLSSWLATWLWNVSSAALPPVVLGYLIVSETLFAMLYAFIAEWRLPSGVEVMSAVLLIGGTFVGLRLIRGAPRRAKSGGA